jgi:hypothetical protein
VIDADIPAALVDRLRRLPPAERDRALRRELPALTLAERFSLLDELGVYHHEESRSGAASSLAETRTLRKALPRLVAEHGITTVLDVPCGDFYWLSRVPLAVDYVGVDVVAKLVEENVRRHGGPRRRFMACDATRDPLPRADLVLSRDLLIHLSLADCQALLANLVATGSRLLVTSHFAAREDNPEILSGDFRAINLCRPPFGFPPPREVIPENSVLAGGSFVDRAMALWEIADLVEVVASWPRASLERERDGRGAGR